MKRRLGSKAALVVVSMALLAFSSHCLGQSDIYTGTYRETTTFVDPTCPATNELVADAELAVGLNAAMLSVTGSLNSKSCAGELVVDVTRTFLVFIDGQDAYIPDAFEGVVSGGFSDDFATLEMSGTTNGTVAVQPGDRIVPFETSVTVSMEGDSVSAAWRASIGAYAPSSGEIDDITVEMGDPFFFNILARNDNSVQATFDGQVTQNDSLAGFGVWDLDDATVSSCSSTSPSITIADVGPGQTGEQSCRLASRWNWVEPLTALDGLSSIGSVGLSMTKQQLLQIANNTLSVGSAVLEFLRNSNTLRTRELEYTLVGGVGDVSVGDEATVRVEVVVPAEKEDLLFAGQTTLVGGGFLAGSAVGALCTVGSFSIVGCIAGISAGIAVIAHADYLIDAAIDPRDDYNLVANPMPISTPFLETIRGTPEGEMLQTAFAMVTSSEAFFLSYARYLGAIEADDPEAAPLQLNLTLLHAQTAIQLQSRLTETLVGLRSATVEEIADARELFRDGSFPDAVSDTFEALGFSDGEAAQFYAAMGQAPDELYMSSDDIEAAFMASSRIFQAFIGELESKSTSHSAKVSAEYLRPVGNDRTDSRNIIRVAIRSQDIGGAWFDAAAIDPASIRIGEAGLSPFRYFFRDIDSDSALDLVLHFDDPGTLDACDDLSGRVLVGESSVGPFVARVIASAGLCPPKAKRHRHGIEKRFRPYLSRPKHRLPNRHQRNDR